MTRGLNVVVAHDYLTSRGGAERVVLALARALDASRIVTSLYEPKATFEGFSEFPVQTSWLNRFAPLRADQRRAFPLLPPTFSRLAVDDADVLVCSSSGWAHGIQTTAAKIVYCHTPARWLYEPDDYFLGKNPRVRQLTDLIGRPLRRWDQRAARSATRYLANSTAVAERIQRCYGIEAEVVHPAPGLTPGAANAVAGLQPGFVLSVGRDRGYKNVQVVIEAMEHLPDQRLVTVGASEGASSTANVRHLGQVSDEDLRWLYASARAVVSAAYEDFGLGPIEGFSFGTPAVLLRAGGFLDSMVPGLTGVFFDAAEPLQVADAIRRLPALPDTAGITAHAARFSGEAFQRRMQAIVAEVC
ncbi:MAG: glycosyltransferase [Geodermatophilaceae bacterium]